MYESDLGVANIMTESSHLLPELEEFLRSHRDELNQLYRMQWLQTRNLQSPEFLQTFQDLANAYLKSSGGSESGASAGALLGIYRLLLQTLPSRSWSREMRDVLESALLDFPALVQDQGLTFLSRIYNAVYSLQQHSLAPQRWWTLMRKLAFLDSEYTGARASRFYRIAASLSYLAGMVHLRKSALVELQSINDDEARALFPKVEKKALNQWLIQMEQNPWAGQSEPAPILAGGYQGFSSRMAAGGRGFFRPPELLGVDKEYDAIRLKDSRGNYLIFADRFGVQIAVAGDSIRESSEMGKVESPDGKAIQEARKAIRKASLPEPPELQGIHFKNTLFCVSPDSHFVWVVPVR